MERHFDERSDAPISEGRATYEKEGEKGEEVEVVGERGGRRRKRGDEKESRGGEELDEGSEAVGRKRRKMKQKEEKITRSSSFQKRRIMSDRSCLQMFAY